MYLGQRQSKKETNCIDHSWAYSGLLSFSSLNQHADDLVWPRKAHMTVDRSKTKLDEVQK